MGYISLGRWISSEAVGSKKVDGKELMMRMKQICTLELKEGGIGHVYWR